MKKIVSAAFLVALTAGVAVAGMTPGSGIVGSPHDMNTVAAASGGSMTGDDQNRVCAFCHTPHHALQLATGEQTPLWSHDFTTTASFTPYASPTLNASIGLDPLVGPSRLCMSCHDGVIAADQHYGGTQTGTNGRLNNDNWNGVAIGMRDANNNGNLGNDHPIGFDYEAVADVDSGIFHSAGRTFLDNNNAPTLTVADVLTNGVMTCATCHDVHNKDNAASTKNVNYFVYSAQDGSSLCLTCHVKGSETKPAI